MIEYKEAKAIAIKYLNESSTGIDDDPIVIQEDQTLEMWFGWIFEYNTWKFVLGEDNLGLSGNHPIVVNKRDGAVSDLTGLKRIATYIALVLRYLFLKRINPDKRQK